MIEYDSTGVNILELFNYFLNASRHFHIKIISVKPKCELGGEVVIYWFNRVPPTGLRRFWIRRPAAPLDPLA